MLILALKHTPSSRSLARNSLLQLKEKGGRVIALKEVMLAAAPTKERWFHGKMSKATCERLLMEKAEPGSFLVWQSSANQTQYILSVRWVTI